VIAESHQQKDPEIRPVVTKEEVLEIREFIRRNVIVDPETRRDIVRIVQTLGPEGGLVAPEDFYLLPEGERGYLFLERGAKTRAFLQGRDRVTFTDVAVLAFPILNHRIGFQYAHRNTDGNERTRELISRAVERVVENGARGL